MWRGSWDALWAASLVAAVWAAMAVPVRGLRAHEMVKVGDRVGRPPAPRYPRQTLVLLQTDKTKDSHSEFFDGLTALGHTLDFQVLASTKVVLETYRERNYDNVILFAPKAASFKLQESLLALIDAEKDGEGINVLVAGGEPITDDSGQIMHFSTGTAIRAFANQCGIDFDAEASAVIDHTASLSTSGNFVINATESIDAPQVLSSIGGVAFSGMGMLLNPENYKFTFPILWGGPATYSGKIPLLSDPMSTGSDTVLVAAMQGLNSARVTFSGSFQMFSNEFFRQYPANSQFALELAAWTFHQRGVLTWSNLLHHKVGEVSPPYMYRIKDAIDFHVDLWTLSSAEAREWQPYRADDVQLELTMIDPYIRTFLTKSNESNATYHSRIKSPDRSGVYKFVLNYKRLGYNHIHLETLAPQRNFKHNDYERFIWTAAPYYGSCITVLVAFYFLAFFFVYHKGERSEYQYFYSVPPPTSDDAAAFESGGVVLRSGASQERTTTTTTFKRRKSSM